MSTRSLHQERKRQVVNKSFFQLKEQKAEIRCELIKQQKENKKLMEKIEQVGISSPAVGTHISDGY